MGLRFTSPARGERTTAVLGIAVGALFGVCMLTGLLSHLIQHPPGWFAWPSRPVWLYRWSQGLHVFCGIAAVPALLAKLWSVYPNLYRWPPVRGAGYMTDVPASMLRSARSAARSGGDSSPPPGSRPGCCC
jgi:hypothetical protein